METESELQASLEEITSLVHRISDTVEDEISGKTNDGNPIRGLSCKHGDHLYLIFGAVGHEFFTIRYPVNVDHNIAFRRKVGDSAQISERDVMEAREFLDSKLDEVDPDLRREIRVNLIQMLSTGASAISLNTTKQLNIHGFDVDTKIFPQAPSFDVWNFERSVQSTISLGWVGKDYIGMAYGLKEDDQGDEIHEERSEGFELG